MTQQTPDKIRQDVINCRKHLRNRYGLHVDLQLVRQVIDGKIASKALEEIDSMFSSYSGPELADAAEIVHEIEATEACGEDGVEQ